MADCTVRVECGSTHGTGFFVGEGLVLSCAHVVQQHEREGLRIVWVSRDSTACSTIAVKLIPNPTSSIVYSRYPYPDLALLTVDLHDNPSVLLSEYEPEPGDNLYGFGFTDDYRDGDSGYFTFEGPTGGSEVLFKLKSGQVRHGMSGAPLLDVRRGGVCAMLKGSRGVDADLGGRAVPSRAILEHLPQLREAQLAAHAQSAPRAMSKSTPSWNEQANGHGGLQTNLALPSLEVIRFALQPVSAWDGPADKNYVDSVRGLVGPIVEMDNLFGGQDLMRITTRLFRSIQNRIAVGDYQPKIERDLLGATAEIAEVAGWLAYDADDQTASRQLNQEALLLSRFAGDRRLELLILQNMSMQAGYVNRPREALLLARTALDGLPLSSRLSAIFRVREGRALAQEGHGADARNALASARALFSDGSADRDPGWAWWFEEHELAWHEAMAEADLGNWTQAVASFRRSIGPRATTSHRDRYVYRSHLLWALTELGDWRGVEEVLEELAGFVGHIASVRTVSLLTRVGKRLGASRDSVARVRATEHLANLLVAA